MTTADPTPSSTPIKPYHSGKKLVIHPVLFALFPVVSLFSANSTQITLDKVLGTALTVLVVSLALWAVTFLALRNIQKSAIIISAFIFLFFTYNLQKSGLGVAAYYLHIFEQARPLIQTLNGLLGWIILILLIFALFTYKIIRSNHDLSRINQLLNIVSVALVLSVVVSWMFKSIRDSSTRPDLIAQHLQEFKAKVAAEPLILKPESEALPDIYYIILDGYARQDVLADIYDVDNTEFINFLTEKGFYVAADAHTNYKQTALSLSSSLNYEYLDGIPARIGKDNPDMNILLTYIEHNRVFHQLRGVGYQVISFSTGFYYTDISTADKVLYPVITPGGFQTTLINNTPLSLLMLGQLYDWHRMRVLYTLDTLPAAAAPEGPQFVFAHIFCPHPPFVLTAAGEPIHPDRPYEIMDGSQFMAVGDEEEYRQQYRGQVVYITRRITEVIKQILENSAVPPVIILQSDHGPGLYLDQFSLENTNLQERMSILNAYYFPGQDSSIFYPQLTPVNSFKLLFNSYFQAGLTLEEDRSFFTTVNLPYDFVDVTAMLPDRVE